MNKLKKQELIKNAIENKIETLSNEIDFEKYVLFRNKNNSKKYKEEKEKSIQKKKALIDKYIELLKELENE